MQAGLQEGLMTIDVTVMLLLFCPDLAFCPPKS
jgi:hypothetical protein